MNWFRAAARLETGRDEPLRPDGGVYSIALVLPLQGPAGMYGPSCESSARLAVEELNAGPGIAARSIRVIEVDGGRSPDLVAAEVNDLAEDGVVDAVVGWHISAVRQAIVASLQGRLPYVYTALYEGGEHAEGVLLAGETPGTQLRPAMSWMASELGIRSWCVVGNDYVWPRRTAYLARRYADGIGARIDAESYVELGTEDFSTQLTMIERSGVDAVLILLVGEDAVHFNRAFAARGLDDRVTRFSTIIDENVLLAIGADATAGLYSAAGYFGSLHTADSLEFIGRMSARFGATAPVANSLGESCYEGIQMLSHLVEAAGRCEPSGLVGAADRVRYDGPRGPVHLDANHLCQSVYLAVASGLDFDVMAQLTAP